LIKIDAKVFMTSKNSPRPAKSQTRRTGGPQTETGKSIAAKNALRHGLSSQTWFDDTEQSQYDELVAQFMDEYAPCGPTMVIQIERLAMTLVKTRRPQKIENALYEKAKITSAHFSKDKPPNSIASFLPDNEDSQRLVQRIVVDSALPDPEKLNNLARFQVSLDRQMSKIIGEIQVLHVSNQNRLIQGDRKNTENLKTISSDSDSRQSQIPPIYDNETNS
jgi:hypothetical protein